MHATGVFTAFKYLKWDKIAGRPVGKMISMVSNYTFGIYLMHFYLVLLIPEIMHFDMKSIVWRLFGPIVIFIVCGLCSYIVSRIPYIKALIGA
jgi:surface polysaccharide O-acyltransferase-like enzyme